MAWCFQTSSSISLISEMSQGVVGMVLAVENGWLLVPEIAPITISMCESVPAFFIANDANAWI